MLDRDQLETFASVVELGSFERAAQTLNVTRGAVSQRVKALEEFVGAVLILRERPVRATARGELLMRHVRALRMLEGSVLHDLRDDVRSTTALPVAIAVNADSLDSWFGPVLDRLFRRDNIALEVVCDDQDHTFARLSRGEVLGCVSTEHRAMPGYVAEPLGRMRYRCVATPDFMARYFPHGLDVPSVLTAPAVVYDRKDTLHDQFLEGAFGFRIERYPRHHIPAPGALLNAIRAGGTYGLVPVPMTAEEDLSAWGVRDVSPGRHVDVRLFWHHWQCDMRVAADITSWVLDEARRRLYPLGDDADDPPR